MCKFYQVDPSNVNDVIEMKAGNHLTDKTIYREDGGKKSRFYFLISAGAFVSAGIPLPFKKVDFLKSLL